MTALLEAKPKATPGHDDGEFVDFGWRPVFIENRRDGHNFDGQAMERISANCNKRIRDTEDYCPLVIVHTKEGDLNSQEVVGALGPYKVAPFGPEGKKAIWARERWYKDDAHKRRKYPRISVEYWGPKADPTNGYLDPASLLGSETPELDLGFRFSKQSAHEMVHYRYAAEAAAPGGTNTFAPSLGGDDESPARYQQGGTLTQADLQQIVSALRPAIQEIVKSEVAAMRPVGADPDGMATDTPADELEGDLGLGDDSDLDEVEGDGEFGGDDEDFDAAEDGLADDGDMSLDSDDEVPPEHADESLGDEKKDRYAKTFDGLYGEPIMADSPEQEVIRFKKEAAEARKKNDELTKELGELRVRYARVADEKKQSDTQVEDLRERVAGMEKRERHAVRFQKLRELENDGYLVKVDDELRDFEDAPDDQFDRHLDRIRSRYQRVPQTLASTGLKVAGPARTDADDRRQLSKRERYSKVAMDNVQLSRQRGESLDFAREFNRLMKEDPERIGGAAA